MAELTAVTAVLRIPLDRIQPGPNARGHIGDVDELAASMQAIGQQDPIQVTDLGDGRYQVLDGHRRHAAARKAGLLHLDAIVRRDAGPAIRIQQQLAMHTHGRAFDPIAEAEALRTLMWDHNHSPEDIARAVGKSPAWVRDRVGLLQLRPDEQRDVAAGRTTLAQAKVLVAVRRAERDGRPAPAPEVAPVTSRGLRSPSMARGQRHCPTCHCVGGG